MRMYRDKVGWTAEHGGFGVSYAPSRLIAVWSWVVFRISAALYRWRMAVRDWVKPPSIPIRQDPDMAPVWICGEMCSHDPFGICTEPSGHTGPHVATGRRRGSVCEWSNDR